jgi:predicted enzyme related to lactoylglutathione lyase
MSMITHLFASIPVADRDVAVAWYERLAGRSPDLIPNEREAARQVRGAAWIYLLADAGRAGSALHTLLVDDLDAFLAELAERGIESGPVETMGEAARFALVTDPDGNRLKVAQPPA